MASWKQNKMVGIVAGLILIASVTIVVANIARRIKPMPRVEIDTTQKIPGPGIMK